jgi:ubiquinone/menaquinone biosynthesis C-methylase UbiE
MLEEAQKVSNTNLCQVEMRSLGFANACFVGIWCNAALLHLPKRELPKALAEIFRVLAPKSPFYLSLQKGAEEGIESGPSGNAPRYFARYDGLEMEYLLEQAGFAIIRQDISIDEYHRRSWLWFETIRVA